jgi:CubicO group peptidase (beta-lactamase class C family)
MAAGLDPDEILRRAVGHGSIGVTAAIATSDQGWTGVAGGSIEAVAATVGPPILRVASITKLFTAAAVLLLRDRGALSLADEVRGHVPELAVDGVTIGEFLCHGSGLQRETPDDPGWQTGAFLAGEDFLAAIGRARAVLPRMTRWKYSNLAYNTLGLVIERASRRSFGAFVGDELIEPLGLTDTTVGRPEGDERLVVGHQHIPGIEELVVDPTWREPVPEPAGGIWSTAGDIARFGLFLAGSIPGPLGRSTLLDMRRPRLMVDEAWRLAHGLGPMLLRNDDGVLVGHAGEVAGFAGWVLASPPRGVAAACLSNVMDAGIVLPIVLELLGATDIGRPDRDAGHAEEAAFGTFAGDGSTIVLASLGEELVARWPGSDGPLAPGAVRLVPTGDDRFVFVDGGPYVGEELEFERDSSGRITGFEACTYRFDRIGV